MRNCFWLLIIFFAFSFVSCGDKKPKVQAKSISIDSNGVVTITPEMENKLSMKLDAVVLKTVNDEKKIIGSVEVPAQDKYLCSSFLGGTLRSCKGYLHKQVRKGEVIAEIEDAQYIQLQQDFLTAKSKNLYLANEYKRQKELNMSKAISDKVFQQTEAEYNSNNILIISLKEKLKLIGINPEKLNETNISRSIKIVSPIEGIITAIYSNTGKYVQPSETLFEIVTPNNYYLKMTVSKMDVSKFVIGQNIIAFTHDASPKKIYSKVKFIGEDIANDSNFFIHCNVNKHDKTMLPGTALVFSVQSNEHEEVYLHSESIIKYKGTNAVLFSTGNHQYEIIKVVVGAIDNGLVNLISSEKPLRQLLIVNSSSNKMSDSLEYYLND